MVENVKDLLDIWDYSENSKIGLNPKDIPVNSCKIAFWKCKNGHSWKEEIGIVYRRKTKCFYCSGRFVWPGENDLQTLYPELATEWDYDKNGVTPDNVSPRDTNAYWWKCKNGHPSFRRTVEHRVSRHDTCPYCSGRKVIEGVNDLQTLYPNIASEWDYERNKGTLPSNVSPDSWKSFSWICPKGHHYKKKVYLRTHSTSAIDCTICTKSHSTSFPEQAVFYYAKKFFPDAINGYKGLSKTRLELDIFIPSWKLGIEYDGKYSHSSQDAKEREQRKYKICKAKGIRLIRIREGEQGTDDVQAADDVFFVKKRPNDLEMNAFLIFFFTQITVLSNVSYSLSQMAKLIDIRRDRPIILDYLIDIEHSFGMIYPELAKNWDYDSNKNLTPFMLPPGSNFPATFKCERCGKRWSAAISTVVKWNRTLCKKCSMGDNGLRQSKKYAVLQGSLAEKYPNSVLQWDQQANGDLTPSDIPSGYSREVFWKCPDCGYKWKQSPCSRTIGKKLSPCPHCAGRVAMPGVDDLETLYPDIAKEWDYSKNNGVLPSEIRPNSYVDRYWICSKHNKGFKTSPHFRLKGVGCSRCKGEKITEKQGFKIEQYDKELKYIATFKSVNEAARNLKISPEAIRLAARNGTISADSYWKYVGTEFGILKPDKKHQVVSFDPKTGKSTEYESAREAERLTGIGHSKIMKCCRKEEKYNTAGGLYWHFKGEDLVIRKNKTTAIPVVGTNIKTKEVIKFESIREASQFANVDKSLISECCKGKNPHRKTAGGYYWKYIER